MALKLTIMHADNLPGFCNSPRLPSHPERLLVGLMAKSEVVLYRQCYHRNASHKQPFYSRYYEAALTSQHYVCRQGFGHLEVDDQLEFGGLLIRPQRHGEVNRGRGGRRGLAEEL
jgi:hypothetical protein